MVSGWFGVVKWCFGVCFHGLLGSESELDQQQILTIANKQNADFFL